MSGGIYVIRRIATGECYVGRAVSFSRRQQEHYGALRRGTHRNPKLQRAWLKYGDAAFEFKPLVICAPGYAVELEQVFLDMRYGEYNISRSATSGTRAGDVFSPEHCARIAAALRGKARTTKQRVAAKKNMVALHADPAFCAANATRAEARMRQHNKDAAFTAKRVDALRACMATPEYKEKIAAAAQRREGNAAFKMARAEMLRKRNSDPAFKAKLAAGRAARKAAEQESK